MGMDKIVANVYETRNYDMFRKLLGNRDVTEQRIEKIKYSIENVGYVLNPCVINSKNEVIDGQGRIEALKRLGLPVHYVIDKNAGLEQCVQLNINGTNWNTIDYINSYVAQDNENYINLKKLIDAFPDINIDVIAYAITGRVMGSEKKQKSKKLGCRNNIANGRFVCTEKEAREANAKLKYLNDFIQIAKSNNKKGSPIYLLKAVLFAAFYTDADKEQLYNKMFNYQQMLIPFHNMREALSSISEIYNYYSKKKRMDFELLYRSHNEKMQVYVNKYGKSKEEAV